MSNFKLTSLSCSNYYGKITELTGSAKVKHEGTDMEFTIKLGPEECLAIFTIVSDRVAEMFKEVAEKSVADLAAQRSSLLEQHVNQKQAVIEEVKPEVIF